MESNIGKIFVAKRGIIFRPELSSGDNILCIEFIDNSFEHDKQYVLLNIKSNVKFDFYLGQGEELIKYFIELKDHE